MLDNKIVRERLHELSYVKGVRPPKFKLVSLARRFYNYFGFSENITSLKILGFYDYKTKTILLEPRATLKDLEHEFHHYLQHKRNPKDFIAWEKKMRVLARKSVKAWLKAYYNSWYERNA